MFLHHLNVRTLMYKSRKEKLLEIGFSTYLQCNIVLVMPNNDEFSAFFCHYGYRPLNTTSLVPILLPFTLFFIILIIY